MVNNDDDFTLVLSKSQKKKPKKNKKNLLQKSDSYNTRFKEGISKPKIFHEQVEIFLLECKRYCKP